MTLSDSFKLMEEMIDSKENESKSCFWDPQETPLYGLYKAHGVPKAGSFEKAQPLVTVNPPYYFFGKALGFNMDRFYTEPEEYLKWFLKFTSWRQQNFKDDIYFSRDLGIYYGSIFEPNLFGLGYTMMPDQDPWHEREPLIKNYEDLDRLEAPDFFKSGLMPRIHYFYQRLQELVPEGWTVHFPKWVRGIFPVATYLRGYDTLLMDMIANPDFVHRLMRFVTDCRKQWVKDRAEFLGEAISPSEFFNDEVNVPMVSPQFYQEFIFPYEKEIAQFQGGLAYWHSCGNTLPFLSQVKEIPNLKLLHIGPITDLKEAVQIVGPDQPIEICVHPINVIQRADEAQMRAAMEKVISTCLEHGMKSWVIRAEALSPFKSTEEDVKQIQRWLAIVRDTGHRLIKQGEVK